MTFRSFSQALLKLEQTPSRNEMTRLLADLFRAAAPSEIASVVYLALGRIAPLYRDIDFNLADRLIVRAIARASGVGDAEVAARYRATGDLGETASSLSLQSPDSPSPPNLPAVFDSLAQIAAQSGAGSQDKKLDQTAELLKKLDPLSAKYVVRIILGKLRLGFSDKTVLDALSLMIAGDKSARKMLEAAYNVRPDAGWLAHQVKNSKFSARNAFGIADASGKIQNLPAAAAVGTPIIPALCQRLPSTEEMVKKMGTAAVEPKWDGQRIQAHVWILGAKTRDKKIEVRLFTRGLEDVTDMFPDLAGALRSLLSLSSLPPSSLILDGEVVAVDNKTGKILPFQTMITRKRKYGIQEKLSDVPVRYMVFDILYYDGRSLMEEPYAGRREILESLFTPSKSPKFPNVPLSLAPRIVTDDPSEIRKFLKRQIDQGLEGIVAKKTSAPYSPGRTGYTWVKLKWEGAATSGGLLDTIDGVVMGTYAGRGKRSNFGVGAFLVGILSSPPPASPNLPQKILTLSKIGTGLTDRQWRELRVKSEKLKVKSQPEEYDVPKELAPDVWLAPELVAEIQADNLTVSPLHSAGYALRFPRLVRWRGDKRADQITTLEEIKEMRN